MVRWILPCLLACCQAMSQLLLNSLLVLLVLVGADGGGGSGGWSRDARLLSRWMDLPCIHLLGGLGLEDSERCPLYCGPCR